MRSIFDPAHLEINAQLRAGIRLSAYHYMNREYRKSYSAELHRDMETLVFGHAGIPLMVFPTSMGRFFEYEDFGMIEALGPKIESGGLQVFCPDSVDAESWYNRGAKPRQRVLRHVQYERYILHELLPFLRSTNHATGLAVTGCSFGGYHAVNFSLRHPDLVAYCVSMGGMFDVHPFLNGYYDDDCYFNCPLDFLPNLADEWYLRHYRQMKIVLGVGECDMFLDQNLKLSSLLAAKAIFPWLDVWGDHTGHDWPWWQLMARKFFRGAVEPPAAASRERFS